MKKTILAVGAHHDDVELRAGGTLAKYAEEGSKIIYAVASTTPHYHPGGSDAEAGKFLSNNEVISLRKKEAAEGAEIIGADEVHFFDFKSMYWYKSNTADRVYLDGISCTSEHLRYLEEEIPGREFMVSAHRTGAAVGFMADFIREKEVDIVLTHSPDDCHWEHYAAANLMLQAVRKLKEAGVSVGLYGWEFGGMGSLCFGFHPSRFEDITGTIDIKCRAVSVFKSQFPDRNAEMFAARARTRAEAYGRLCGFKYAEPFADFNVRGGDGRDELMLPDTYRPPETVKGLF